MFIASDREIRKVIGSIPTYIIIYDCCIICKQKNYVYVDIYVNKETVLLYSVAGVSVYLGSEKVLLGRKYVQYCSAVVFYRFRIFLLYNQLNTNKSISSQSCNHSDIFHCEDMGY